MPDALDYSGVTLAILAGGHGRRMGIPKSNLQIGSQPILEYLLDHFSWPGKTLLITAPGLEHPPGRQRFDREAVDPVADQGPLRGVLTALENSTTPMVLIVTLDMPCIRANHLRWSMSQLVARPECLGLMLRRALDGEEQIEPFPFACRRKAAGPVSAHLASGRRAVHGLLGEKGFIAEPAPHHWPASAWTNLNRPQELEAFLESIG
jgi:molybdopterin-guanine dinucleotide biosynthesis protein A